MRMDDRQTMMFVGVLAVVIMLAVFFVLAQDDPTINPQPAEEAAADIVDATVEAAEETATALDEFIERLTTSPQSDVARVLLVVGGIILLAAGWRVYDFIIIIAGFLIGAMIMLSLVTTENTLIALGAMLLGGLVGAALGAFLYYVAVFLIGAYLGTLLTAAAANALSLEPVSALALLAGGIVGGVVLIGLSFEFLVLLSSLVGGQMLSLGLGLGVGWTVLFVLAGIVIQFALIRGFNYDFRRRRRSIRLFA